MDTKKEFFRAGGCVLLWCAAAFAQYNPDRISEARVLYQSGRYGEVIDICRSVPGQSPASMPAYSGLVTSLLKRDEVAEAELAARKAMELAPESPVPHDLLGEVYYRQGKLSEAQAEYKNALTQGGALARAWWGLGRIAEASSMYKTAAKLYESAYQLDPKDSDIFRSYSLILPKEEKTVAIEKYLGITKVMPASLEKSPPLPAADERPFGDFRMFELSSPYEKTEIDWNISITLPIQLEGWDCR